ncbi:MAG TPA: M28 family metallopeptidase [Chthonomonadaceae bacterium]|nr:M28 family metallopeptidase [Chthonomonadaceae bacterium]
MKDLKRRLSLFGVAGLCAVSLAVYAQGRQQGRVVARPPRSKTAPRPMLEATQTDIRRIVREIDSYYLQAAIRKLVSFDTRNTLSVQDDPRRGIGAARDWILSQFQQIRAQSGGRLEVEMQTFEQPAGPRIPHPVRITNIAAILPGDLPNLNKRVYVVSAHYDSRASNADDPTAEAPGADDDGSGVAAVLEMARVMSQYHYGASIVFLCVAGEEQGLYGSTYFADRAKEKGWRIMGMLNNDIIGSSHGANGIHDNHSVRVFSEGVPSEETPTGLRILRAVGGENDSPSRELARFIQGVGARYVHHFDVNLVYRRDRFLRGGDQIPFQERGYPAVRFTEPNEDFRHQHQNVRSVGGVLYGDLPQFLDFDYLAQVTRVNAAALAMLALAPATPQEVGIVTRELTNDTELKWAPNTEPDLAGYYVEWRSTTAPSWERSLWVGNVTRYTLHGLSKDDYYFGVRAMNRQDDWSPVAFAQPTR